MNPASSDPIVVTGIGLSTPLGAGREASWRGILSGDSAVSLSGARVPLDEGPEPRALMLARRAGEEALADAGVSSPLGERGGVVLSASKPLLHRGAALPPETVPLTLAREWGAGGPVMNLSAACATGLQSVMAAAGWIREGRCDGVLAGAAESSFHPLYESGFRRMGVISKSGRVRPFDRARDGFIMGEGAGAFYLETLSTARRRGARVYGVLRGWAFGSDAHDAVRFNGEGRQMARTLARALEAAGFPPSSLDYLNAHGTGTMLNDALESLAFSRFFDGGRAPLVSSTKGATGHLLGATGAVELGFTLLALRDGQAPPTLNLNEPETDRLDFVPGLPRRAPLRRAASVSFGFGGSLAALALEVPL